MKRSARASKPDSDRLAQVIVAGIVLMSMAIVWWKGTLGTQSLPAISSFEDCAAAGYAIMESYPPRCHVPGVGTFTQGTDLPESATL